MASGGVACVKYVTFLWNLGFGLSGILIVILGAVIELKYKPYSNFVSDQIWTIPTILIIIGAIVATICLLGCVGALKENKCMLMTFALAAAVLFLTEIIFGVYAYIQIPNLGAIIEPQFDYTIMRYNKRPDYKDAWSIMQTELECCGVHNADIWERLLENSTIPASCCSMINLNEAETCTKLHAHPEGCFPKLMKLLYDNDITITAVALSLVVAQVLAILFACCLQCSFRRDYGPVQNS